jgi:hypothetical protein
MAGKAIFVSSIVILVLTLSCSTMAIAQNYQLVPNTTQQKQTLLSDGSPAVMVRFLIASETVPAAPRLDVTLIYDSKSGRAWWTYQRAQQDFSGVDLTRPWVVARAADGHSLVGFLLLGTQLIVHPSTASAGLVSATETAAIENLSSQIRAIQDGSDRVGTEIRLVPPLSRDFFYQPFDASPISKGKIQRVSPTDTGWQIDLEGVNSQSAVLKLSRDFAVLNAPTR